MRSLVYSPAATVHRLFEDQAHRAPDAVALVQPASFGASSVARLLTYRELDARTSQLTHALRAAGITQHRFVAIMMDRSIEMIVAMLATLKAGGAYLMLDPADPDERLRHMLSDTRSSLCVTQPAHETRAHRLGVRALIADSVGDTMSTLQSPGFAQRGEDAAYVMYTSGSTGRPKGVVVPHRAIARLVQDQSFARLDATRTLLHLAPATFDASTFEIWGALLNGARCVLAPSAKVPDLPKLRETITQTGVTTIWLTVSLFNTIIDHAPSTLETVDEVITGGEALSERHIRRAQELLPNLQLINGYGPTESTTFACCYRIPRPVPAHWRSIPIGTAIANTSALVLDTELREVPRGEKGDLYVGGDGLALGYLNLPELTEARFITTKTFGRLYRTGDRARVREDGALDFLGRTDNQVKIRGYRVELGEIENALRSLDGVADAVVVMREDTPGDKRLIAYYTLTDCTAGPSSTMLREQLRARLPEYMVPSAFSVLDAIPLTTNGKADRAALPAPGRRRPALDRPPVAPRTAVERWIAAHWRDVLQIDEVGVHDKFFELGGTSIAAMRFLAHLNEETTTPLAALLLFRAPTIAELAGIVEREYGDALPLALQSNSHAPTTSTTAMSDRLSQRQNELTERRLRRRRAT